MARFSVKTRDKLPATSLRRILLGIAGNSALILLSLQVSSLALIAANPQQAGATADEQQQFQTAKEAMDKGDFPRAITIFQQLAAEAPNVAEIHANLGTACYFAGRFDQAIREFRRALTLKPELKRPQYFLTLSEAESGHCQEALPKLNHDYEILDDPQLKRLTGLDAARCSMALGEPRDSARLLLSLTRDFPNDPDVLYLAAHVFSDFSAATSEHLLAVAPASYQAHRFNAEVLESEGKLTDAIQEYRRVLQLNPRLAGIHYEIGRLLLATTKGEAGAGEAEEEFQKELEINPLSAPAEVQLGDLAWQARHWDGAEKHFKRATEIDPELAEGWAGLGKSLGSAGEYEQAAAPLERAVKLDPSDPDAHYRLAFVLRHLGREKEAEQELAAYHKAEQSQLEASKKIRQGMTDMSSGASGGTPSN